MGGHPLKNLHLSHKIRWKEINKFLKNKTVFKKLVESYNKNVNKVTDQNLRQNNSCQ